MKKKEIILFGGIFLIALISWIAMTLLQKSRDYGSIRIVMEGAEFGNYSLSEDQIIKIGDTNICEIRDHQASMIEAQCPDGICKEMGPITENGGMITCLPNQVIIEGVPSEDAVRNDLELDAIG